MILPEGASPCIACPKRGIAKPSVLVKRWSENFGNKRDVRLRLCSPSSCDRRISNCFCPSVI